jgi:selenocysteine lyase/cysteine desulfurase
VVLLDCFQSVGAVDIDVGALGVDFAAAGMLKYLLGTAGIGFLYVARRPLRRRAEIAAELNDVAEAIERRGGATGALARKRDALAAAINELDAVGNFQP